MTRVKVNLNAMAAVTLTERGAQVYNDFCRHYLGGASLVTWHELVAGQCVRFPLWEIMQIFGPKLFQGDGPLFESNDVTIEIEAPKLTI